jgi:hypothetical protein
LRERKALCVFTLSLVFIGGALAINCAAVSLLVFVTRRALHTIGLQMEFIRLGTSFALPAPPDCNNLRPATRSNLQSLMTFAFVSTQKTQIFNFVSLLISFIKLLMEKLG